MSKDRFTASRYHLMSAAQKRDASLSVVRESSVACPSCDTQVMPSDLLAHLEQRCAGPREPGPRDRWVSHAEVMAMGVPRSTLNWWTRNQHVRFVGGRMDRKYLHRDLVKKVAQTRGFRRR